MIGADLKEDYPHVSFVKRQKTDLQVLEDDDDTNKSPSMAIGWREWLEKMLEVSKITASYCN